MKDGITNNGGVPTSSFQCNACNTHVSQYADDDGGFLRIFVGQYYKQGPVPVAGTGGQYHPLVPARILDSRYGIGNRSTPLAAGEAMILQVAGQGGVPVSGAYAAVLNVTVTNTTAASHLILYPAGVSRQQTSNLNWTAGRTVANPVEIKLGAGGQVSIFYAGSTDVIADVAGWVSTPPPAGRDGLYNPLLPQRLLDTRIGTGGYSLPLGPQGSIGLQVGGRGGVPTSGVNAVVLNVTVTNPTTASFLTVWPVGVSMPTVSNVNFVPGQTVPNRVMVKLGAGGQVGIYNQWGSADVVVDVNGWFTDSTSAGTGAGFVGLSPYRIVDTRDGTGGLSPLGPGQTAAMMVAGRGGVPAMHAATPPSAAVLNVTVTNTTRPSHLTAWPDGSARPLASDLNWVTGLTLPNLVVVKVGPTGMVDVFNYAGSIDLVVDVVGYYN